MKKVVSEISGAVFSLPRMVGWGLLDGAACSSDLVENRIAEPAAAPADD